MGGKITIDSATLMNKGLEVIEAHHLFGLAYDRIDVVVHPQSIVHSLIHLNDGASLAHLGYPDMRVPISYALHHPDRADVPVEPLDLAELGAADLRGARRGHLRLPAPGARGRRGGRHRAVRAERRQRGRRAGVPRRAAAVHRHRRAVIERTLEAMPAAPGAATSPTSSRSTPRRASARREALAGAAV